MEPGRYTGFFILSLLIQVSVIAQKKISELSIVYDYSLVSGNTPPTKGQGLAATYSVFIKGNLSRTDLQSSLFSSTVFFDSKTRGAVILKELSGQKLLIRMNPENWEEKNRRYEGIQFAKSPETKVIAGYSCRKATALTADGFVISVYYTTELYPENKEYDPPFMNLEGLPLEYEFSKGTATIRYTLASINLNPVPASKFDIPKSGFREMTYEESKKLNVGG